MATKVLSIDSLPRTLDRLISGATYSLVAATFFTPGHYHAAMCNRKDQCFEYDGMNDAEERFVYVGDSQSDLSAKAAVNHVVYINKQLL